MVEFTVMDIIFTVDKDLEMDTIIIVAIDTTEGIVTLLEWVLMAIIKTRNNTEIVIDTENNIETEIERMIVIVDKNTRISI